VVSLGGNLPRAMGSCARVLLMVSLVVGFVMFMGCPVVFWNTSTAAVTVTFAVILCASIISVNFLELFFFFFLRCWQQSQFMVPVKQFQSFKQVNMANNLNIFHVNLHNFFVPEKKRRENTFRPQRSNREP
jgi:hypothetical protein